MKFIYQFWPGHTANESPSLLDQTEEEAIKTAVDLSNFVRHRLIIVRYSVDKKILCMAEQGNLFREV